MASHKFNLGVEA